VIIAICAALSRLYAALSMAKMSNASEGHGNSELVCGFDNLGVAN
jgi:hypothetical protein